MAKTFDIPTFLISQIKTPELGRNYPPRCKITTRWRNTNNQPTILNRKEAIGCQDGISRLK